MFSNNCTRNYRDAIFFAISDDFKINTSHFPTPRKWAKLYLRNVFSSYYQFAALSLVKFFLRFFSLCGVIFPNHIPKIRSGLCGLDSLNYRNSISSSPPFVKDSQHRAPVLHRGFTGASQGLCQRHVQSAAAAGSVAPDGRAASDGRACGATQFRQS